MHTFEIVGTGASDAAWARSQALREIRAAVDAVNAAAAVLVRLTVDTEWDSDGVRALHQALVEFAGRTSAEEAALQDREHELHRADLA